MNASTSNDLEEMINSFLSTIDIRQIVKMDYQVSGDNHKRSYILITYIDFEDIRDIKIDSILNIK
jgi:hypothetical protein